MYIQPSTAMPKATLLRTVPNFPEPGVTFYDIAPLLADPKALDGIICHMSRCIDSKVTKIIALDARGFIFGSLLASKASLGLVLARKKGKLPGSVVNVDYSLEYGSQKTLEIQADSINENDVVIVVDDILATGGTAKAAVDLVEKCGAKISAVMVLATLTHLKGIKLMAHRTICSYYNVDTEGNITRSDGTALPDEVATLKSPVWTSKCKETDERAIVFYHPDVAELALDLVMRYPYQMRPGEISWGKFPDGWSNIKFETQDNIMNRDVIFFMSAYRMESYLEQICLTIALCRQFAASVTIVIPYFGPATMERVVNEGDLATAEPIMKLLSKPIPMTSKGLPALLLLDIHDIRERFYPTDNVTPKLASASNLILPIINKEKMTIVFPDEGAYKRFGNLAADLPTVTFMKKRMGSQRLMILASTYNMDHWDDDNNPWERLIIWDDLVHSGGTLIECAKAVREEAMLHCENTTVSAFVTHGVFENNGYERFLKTDSPIDLFYVTNSIPAVAEILRSYPEKFKILNVIDAIAPFLLNRICFDGKLTRHHKVPSVEDIVVWLSSESTLGTQAVEAASEGRVFCFPCKSGVSDQPWGRVETLTGLYNRHNALRKHVFSNYSWQDLHDELILVSIENGIIEQEGIIVDVGYILCEYFCLGQHVIKEDLAICGIVRPEHMEDYNRQRENDRNLTYGKYIKKYHDPNVDDKDWSQTRSSAIEATLAKIFYSIADEILD